MHSAPDALGVFDSGLGGLSVLHAIRQRLPAESLLYVADSAYAPYGDQSEAFIIERSLAIGDFLLTQGVKALVIACNTATAYAAEIMRAQLAVQVIAIEPGVKPAVQVTRNGVIGVLVTQRTARSPRLQRLIAQHASGKQVLVQACPGLVEYVEAGDFTSPALQARLQHYIQPLLAQGADTLVLGCTHYPFLKPILQTLLPKHVHIVETSAAVAQQLERMLQQHHLLATPSTVGQVAFYSSQNTPDHRRSLNQLWGEAVSVTDF